MREVTLLVDQFLPIRFNKPIRWTAAAHPALPVEFRFWRFDASTGWMEVQPYGPNPTYTWTPVYADVGVHSLQVWARRIGSPAEYDSWESTTFSISTGEPVRFFVFKSSSPSPMAAGSPITWTAEATGGRGPLSYQFWRLDADGWHIVQGYSTSGTYTWTPTAADVGSHTIQVWARSVDVPASYEGYTGATFEISAPNPVAVSSLTTTSALPALVGQPITWRATASGGVPPLQYQFWRLDAGAWRLVQDYGPSSTYTWTPGAADIGPHALQVWVRSFGSVKPYDAWAGAAFSVATATPATLTSLSRFPSSTPPAGMEIQWTAVATGGLSPLQYQFWRLDGGAWTMVRDWGPSNTYTWRTALADIGAHALQVWVRSAGSSATYESWLGEVVHDRSASHRDQLLLALSIIERRDGDHLDCRGVWRRGPAAIPVLAVGCRRLAPGAGLRTVADVHVDADARRRRPALDPGLDPQCGIDRPVRRLARHVVRDHRSMSHEWRSASCEWRVSQFNFPWPISHSADEPSRGSQPTSTQLSVRSTAFCQPRYVDAR